MKLRVEIDDIRNVAEILTGYGAIEGILPDGVILWELDDEETPFETGRKVDEVERELSAYFTSAQIVPASRSWSRK